MSHRFRIVRFVRHWHARTGVLLAILFLFLALSGLALNHTDALGLGKHDVNASWLMRWYGLKPSVPTRGYLFKDGYLAAADGRWVMDGRVLSEANQAPVGAITWGDMRAVAGADNLYLYLPDGQLVDKLSGVALPGSSIKRLGSIGAQLALETAQGSFVSDDGLAWQPSNGGQPIWSGEQALPDSASTNLKKSFAPSLSLERIILDLHSGRIFGRYGPILMDIAALGLIILSLSGMWIYLRTVRRQHHL
jgi:uncharacterized iron-regulated membrane protein